MTDIQAWLDEVGARLDAVKREPAQEERDYESESQAWSDLYQHAPTDLARATNALQAVLDIHTPVDEGPTKTICTTCTELLTVKWPCPTVRAIQDAIGEPQ